MRARWAGAWEAGGGLGIIYIDIILSYVNVPFMSNKTTSLTPLARSVMQSYSDPAKSIYRHHCPYLYLDLDHVRELCVLNDPLLRQADKLQFDLADDDEPLWEELSENQHVDFIMSHLSELGIPDTDEALLVMRQKFVADNVEKPCQALTLALMDRGYITLSSNAFSSKRTNGVVFACKEDLYLGPAIPSLSHHARIGEVRQVHSSCQYVVSVSGEFTVMKPDKKGDIIAPLFDASEYLPKPEDYAEAPCQERPELTFNGRICYQSADLPFSTTKYFPL